MYWQRKNVPSNANKICIQSKVGIWRLRDLIHIYSPNNITSRSAQAHKTEEVDCVDDGLVIL